MSAVKARIYRKLLSLDLQQKLMNLAIAFALREFRVDKMKKKKVKTIRSENYM